MNEKLVQEAKKLVKLAEFYNKEELRVSDAPEKLKNEISILALLPYGDVALKYASEDLHKDKSFLLACLVRNIDSIEYISSDLVNDTEFVSSAIRLNSKILGYLPEEIFKYREVASEALRINPKMINKIPPELRHDKDFLDQVIKSRINIANDIYNTDTMIKELIKGVDNDKQLALFLMEFSQEVFYELPEEMKLDREIALAAVKCGIELWSIEKNFYNDREILQEAVRNDGRDLRFASDELKKDRELVLEAVRKDGSALEFASDELKDNMDFAREALRRNPSVYDYLSDNLRADEEFAKENGKEPIKLNTKKATVDMLKDYDFEDD